VRSPPHEKEGVAEPTCDELTVPPTPCPPVLLGAKRKRKIRSKAKPGKKGGVGDSVFKIWFYFSLSCSDLISDKIN